MEGSTITSWTDIQIVSQKHVLHIVFLKTGKWFWKTDPMNTGKTRIRWFVPFETIGHE